MEIIRERLSVPISQRTSEVLWDELSKSYKPTINMVRGKCRQKIGIDFMDGSLYYGGEIFFTNQNQLLYYLVIDNCSAIEVGTILTTDEGRQIFSGFKEKVRDAVLVGQSLKTSWEPVKVTNTQFELIKEEADTLEIDQQEIEAAFVLKDDNLRSLLQRVSKMRSCFQEDLLQGENDYETPGMLSQLEMLGLVTKEYFIFCSKTGQQISRVNSLSAVEDARAHGLRCFNCGRLISEEKISTLVQCSPLGDKFSKLNYWLALHIMYILEDLGINIEKVYYKTEKNNKIFDLFVNTYGEFFMFEVKDEPVRLEDIFMFLTRVKFFRPFRAILVSAHPVPLDVRMYLKNYLGAIPITLVEGLDELEGYVADCFQHKREVFLESIFKAFMNETYVDVLNMFVEKFFKGKEMAPVMAPTLVPKEVTKKEVIKEVPIEKIEEFTEVIPGEELHEIVPPTEEIPEVIETVEIPVQATVEIEKQDETKLEEEEIIEIIKIPEEQPVEVSEIDIIPEAKPSVAPEPIAPEKVDETQVIIEEEKPREEEQEFAMEFMESLPTEILPIEDISLAVDTVEEDLESAVNEIMEIINSGNILSQYAQIEKKLRKINSIGSYSAAIVDKSGLLINSSLDESLDSEAFAAYSVIVLDTIQNSLEESGLQKAQSIHLEGKSGRAKIFPGDNAIIIAYEERKSGEVEDEGGMLPGEIVLREAILKKVLEDLAKIDGIVGNIVTGRDGLPIESNLPSRIDPDTLGYLVGMVISEDEKYLDSLQIGSVRQILIKTPDMFYNMIPIESEAILTSCLDPQVPREVWQSHLPQAALMIKSALS